MFTSLRKAARVFFFAFTFSLIVYSAAVVVHAELFHMKCEGGYCYWLSCGSSAGPYYYKCTETNPSVCGACPTDACDDSAAEQCAQRGYNNQMLWQ